MNQLKVYNIFILIFIFNIVCPFVYDSIAFNSTLIYHKLPIVILDPGHGGIEKGAKNIDNTYEKSISLKLALLIKKELTKKYKVILTRTGDYKLSLTERISIANHSKANLFISLHMLGNFSNNTDKAYIYYYQNYKNFIVAKKKLITDSLQKTDCPKWDQAYIKFKKTNLLLANNINNELLNTNINLQVKTKGAPILLLAPLDMPSILIEFGLLSNKINKQQLILLKLAEGISSGIKTFLQANKPNFN